MTDWWLQDRVVTPAGSAAAPNWWDSDKVINPAPAKPKEERSALKDAAYQLPQGIYQGAENLYNLPNNLVNWGAKKLGFEPPITPVHIAEDYNAAHGIGEPTTTAGRYSRAVGEQLGASALPTAGLIARGAEAVPTAANAISSSLGAGTAGEAAKDANLGPGWQLAASLAGGMAAPNAINSLTAKGPPDPRMVEKTLAAEAAQQEGITVPRAAVAGSVEKPVAAKLAGLPLVGAPLNNAGRTALDQTGNRVAQIANDYGAGNRATAGGNLKDALVDYIETGSRQPIQRLYNNVDALIDDTISHPLSATQNLSQRLMGAQTAAQRAINEKALSPIAEDLSNPQGLTYSGIKQLRTTVGAMLDDALLPEAGTAKPVLKQVYGALTQDLRNSVQNAGQPGALDAFDKANKMNQLASQRREAIAKIVGKSGGNAGENVFETMVQMAQDKGKSSNIEMLTRARRSVDPQTWNDMTSAFVRRMGVNPQTGEFSPDRFLTTYGKLSPEGKQIIFNSTGRSDLSASLDRLAAVSKQFSELYKMGNPSGTGGTNFIVGLLGGGTAGILGVPAAAAGAGGMWLQSKWFASPANVDRMTRTLQARLAYQRNQNPTTEQRATQAVAALSKSLSDQNQ